MRLLTGKEMSAYDQATFKRLGVPSREIMENAGRAVEAVVLKYYKERAENGILVLVGCGNNGGDGLVVARLFKQRGIPVIVVVVADIQLAAKYPDFVSNMESYQAIGGEILELKNSNNFLPLIQKAGVVVDAIFGTGFKGATSGEIATAISQLNENSERLNIPVVAVDIASGVESDTGHVNGEAVRASLTVALQELKLGHVLFPGTEFAGKIVRVDIGVKTDFSDIVCPQRELLTVEDMENLARKFFIESPESHKGNRGHVLVVGGSAGHIGAPLLSAEAAIACGAGLVTCAIPGSGLSMTLSKAPYLMVHGLADDGQGNFSGIDVDRIEELVSGKSAVVIGPGFGVGDGSVQIFRAVLSAAKTNNTSTVIDADALNILSIAEQLYSLLPANCIFTPHLGEMSKLIKVDTATLQGDRIKYSTELAQKIKNIVILKGARSVVANEVGNISINPTASPVLATAGSGDVLCGVIAASLSRGLGKYDAAKFGVFVHGKSGEMLVEKLGGTIGASAKSILEACPVVINQLSHGIERKKQEIFTEVVL